MIKVALKKVTKYYTTDTPVVKDLSLEIEEGEFVVFLGPSGCGKTTTLRMIAGLEEITSGEIYIDGRLVNDVPPRDRDIAMVFQNYALYPHLTVFDNIAFSLKARNFPKDEIEKRVTTTAKMLGIDGYLKRKPKQLSGGERQRVALGRAIVRKPSAFLMDEPLSNLDAKLRVQMRFELAKLHQELGATTIYVTHDQIEALTLGDRLVLMKNGVAQQIGGPVTLYNRPANKYVAGFMGSPPMNFFDARLVAQNGGLYLDAHSFRLKVPPSSANLDPYLNREVTFGLRPEDITDKASAKEATSDNTIIAKVDVVEPVGSDELLYASIGNHTFVASIEASMDTFDRNKLVKKDVEFVFNMKKLHIFDKESEVTILNP
jgi:multiple sugar transport system ATP-binding protein